MNIDREENIDNCRQLIDDVWEYIEAQEPRKAIERLWKIQDDNKVLIDSSLYLQASLNSVFGMAHYYVDKFEKREDNVFLENAIEYFNNFIEIKENAPNILFMRAKCYDYLDKLDEAIRDYKRVIEIDPQAPNAHSFLALALESIGDLKGAEHTYLEALKVDPDDEASAERLNIIKKRK